MNERWAHLRARAATFVSCVAITAGAFAASPELPLKTGSSADLWRTGVNAIFIAVICLAVVAAALHTWRNRIRFQSGRTVPPDAANVEWARRVSPRTTLLIVNWRGKQYLLAENAGATRVVDSHAVEEPRS